MSRSKKIWLGIFTLLPVVCIGLYIVLFFSMFIGLTSNIHEPGTRDQIPSTFFFLLLLVFAALISGFAMMIYYIIDVNKSNVKGDHKLIWILILVLAGGLGNIAYYLVEILGIGKNKESNDKE